MLHAPDAGHHVARDIILLDRPPVVAKSAKLALYQERPDRPGRLVKKRRPVRPGSLASIMGPHGFQRRLDPPAGPRERGRLFLEDFVIDLLGGGFAQRRCLF